MITILRQKYETLVDDMEKLFINNARMISIDLYAEEREELEKQVQEIRSIQKSLRLEVKHDSK